MQVELLLRGEQTDGSLLSGDPEVLSDGPTLHGGSEYRGENERSDRNDPPNHFRASSCTSSGLRPVLLGDDRDQNISVNGGPRCELQKSKFSDQRGHIEDGHKRGEHDDEEGEAEKTEEHCGGHLRSRVEVLIEERAATMIVAEREAGVKDGDHTKGEGDEPG